MNCVNESVFHKDKIIIIPQLKGSLFNSGFFFQLQQVFSNLLLFYSLAKHPLCIGLHFTFLEHHNYICHIAFHVKPTCCMIRKECFYCTSSRL